MRPRILDFGLALLPEETAGQGALFAGTPLYASPEQVLCKPLTPASDVFSFGALTFKVLTGRPPFAGQTAQEVAEAIAGAAPPFPCEVALGVPKDLQAICLACLARNPADRPSASEIVVELGRFLIGEPAQLRPKLYDDLLRRTITEYSAQARAWESQNIISGEESDALQVLHRRLLADEDHWIIDARRVTLLQTILSGGTWLAVVATVLTVWILRSELSPLGRWLVPVCFTLTLLAAGYAALRRRDDLAAATFLAGAVLATAPSCLALLGEAGLFGTAPTNVTQFFAGVFTNQQVLVAFLTALVLSGFGLWRLKMTGFAWTTAALGTVSYLALLMLFNWLDKKPEVKALWCLPLVGSEFFGLHLETNGRVRWTLPFHLVAALALVGGLDTIALKGPTLHMLGVSADRWPYFDDARLEAFSVALNGALFLGLMLATERSASLDLRRASRLLELLAILHILSALFCNALGHRAAAHVRVDVLGLCRFRADARHAGGFEFPLANAGGWPGRLWFRQLPPGGSRAGRASAVHHRSGSLRFVGRAGCVRLCPTTPGRALPGGKETKRQSLSGLSIKRTTEADRWRWRTNPRPSGRRRQYSGPTRCRFSFHAGDLPVQPGARIRPMPPGGRRRQPQHLSRLLEGEADKELQLHQFRFGRIMFRQPVQGFVHGQKPVVVHLHRDLQPIKLHLLDLPAPAQRSSATRSVYENAPHRLGRRGKKMSAVPPGRLPVSAQPQPGLVNQRGGLKRLAGSLAPDFERRQLAQLVVDKRQELVCAQWRSRFRTLVRRPRIAHR